MHKKNWQYNILYEIETNVLMCFENVLILPQQKVFFVIPHSNVNII